jgi:hypothetical protein
MFDSKKILVVSTNGFLKPRQTGRLTVGRNITLILTLTLTSTHVEAGSNISNVTLRVVGGDEEGNLKSPNNETTGQGPLLVNRFLISNN